MRVLGWTDRHARLETQATCQAIGKVGLITAPIDIDCTRATLAAQMRLADRLDAFLPAASGLTMDLHRARDWTETAHDTIFERLVAMTGKAQVSIALEAKANTSQEESGSWLRDRAARHRQIQQRNDQAERAMRRILAPLSTDDPCFIPRRNGLTVHLLAQRRTADRTLDALKAVLQDEGPKTLQGWTCAVTGPLPVFCFTGFSEGA